jgi:hypothetical protein
MAHGETVELAAEQSRNIAIYRLVQHLSDRLAAAPVSAALGADPGEEFADTVAARYLTDVGAWATPHRIDQGVKREAVGVTVATQHQLDAALVERAVGYYKDTYEFRGLTVGRRFPYHGDDGGSAVVVVRGETWFKNVAPGDPVVQVGRDTVATFEEFVRAAPAAFRDASDSAPMVVVVDHEGKRNRLEFARPAGGSPRGKAPIDLLPLELNK